MYIYAIQTRSIKYEASWKRDIFECPKDIHKPATRRVFFNGCLMDTIKVQKPQIFSRILLVVVTAPEEPHLEAHARI